MTTGNLRFIYYEGKDPVYIRHAEREYQPRHCELPVLCDVQRSLASAVEEANSDIRKMFIESPPFFRWIPPWSWAFCRKLGIRVRLSDRLNTVSRNISDYIKQEETSKRLYEW